MSQSISAMSTIQKAGLGFNQPIATPTKSMGKAAPVAAAQSDTTSLLDQISRQWTQLNSRLQTRISQMGGVNGELIKVQMDVNSINLTTQAATQLGEGLSQTVKRLAQVTNG